MNRLLHLQIGKRQTLGLLASALAFRVLTISSEAQIFTLTQNNSVAQINTGSSAGLFNWLVDGVDPLAQQWFWFRVGASGPEAPINTISAPSIFTPDARTLYTRYFNGSFGVEVNYLLTGGSAGSGMASIAETVSITNGTAAPLEFHFFAYADFDLGPNDVVRLGTNAVGLFNEASQTNNLASVEVVATPGANHGEAATFPFTLNRLNDGIATVLNDSAGPVGPGDATSALQWDLTIPPGSSVILSVDMLDVSPRAPNLCLGVTKNCPANCTPYGQPIVTSGIVTNCSPGLATTLTVTLTDNPAATIAYATNTSSGRTYDGTLTNNESVTYTATYSPTVPPCVSSDTITVIGTDSTGASVTNTATATNCAICNNPNLTVNKTCPATVAFSVNPQDTPFQVAITNTGNIPVTAQGTDDNGGLGGPIAIGPVTLNPGDGFVFNGVHHVPGRLCGPLTDHVSITGTGACGGTVSNTASCTTLVSCPPSINCPSNIVEECNGNLTPVTYTVTATDPAGTSLPVVCVPPSGSGFRLGTTNVVCTTVDSQGLSNSCTFSVTVVDTTSPQITCSSNITVRATNCVGAVVTYVSSASDSCGLASSNCVPPSGSTFPLGTTTVTCTAIDQATNRAACTFQVTVEDGIPPTITCPTNIVATNDSGQCSAVVRYSVTATDSCGGCTPLSENFNTSPGGFVPIVPPWNYNPAGGSWVSGQATTALEPQAFGPTLRSPPILVTCGGQGQLTLVHRFGFPQGPWGGGTVQVSINLGPFADVLPVGTNISVSAAAAGPVEPPFVTNVANLGPLNPGNLVVVQFIANGDTGLNVGSELGNDGLIRWEITSVALTVGGSGSVTLVCDPASGSTFPVGTNSVCCVATDAAGNTNTCCFDVTVEDREPPVAACREGVNPSGTKTPVAGKNPASGQNPDGYYQLLGKDNCDADPLIYLADTGSSFIAGPFHNGDVIKLTQSTGKTPSQDPAPAPIVAHLHFKGDGLLYAVDASGNQSAGVVCLVPRPPK